MRIDIVCIFGWVNAFVCVHARVHIRMFVWIYVHADKSTHTHIHEFIPPNKKNIFYILYSPINIYTYRYVCEKYTLFHKTYIQFDLLCFENSLANFENQQIYTKLAWLHTSSYIVLLTKLTNTNKTYTFFLSKYS